MTVSYEMNPPKVIKDQILSRKDLVSSIDKLKERGIKVQEICGGIHLTDSVLGVPRISPITTGALIGSTTTSDLAVSASIRVRDRNLTSLTQTVCDAILLGLRGVLMLKGDAPPEGPKDSKLVASEVVKQFSEQGFGKHIDLLLSLPRNPDFDKIQKKVEAGPTGFVTQVVDSEQQVERIVDKLKPQGFKIIPCVMIASEKNKKSAEMLNVNTSNFENDMAGFVSRIHKIAGDVLVTSPNDFNRGVEVLQELHQK